MILPFILAVLAITAILAQLVSSKISACCGLVLAFILMLLLEPGSSWQIPWIPSWGISFHLSIDGFSWWLVMLSLVMALLASLYAHKSHATILWAVLGVVGTFIAADTFLFFIFWELSLVPVYYALLLDGGDQRIPALIRYVIYTQASGLILLVSVIALALTHFESSGVLSFDYAVLRASPVGEQAQYYLFAGFLLAFLIKLPALPFHAWLPAVFEQAPVPIMLVGILIKTAVFGLVRFSWPLFPLACRDFSQALMILGVAGIIYGALLAFSQHEPRKILSYSTISHVGLILIGVFCHNQPSYFGVLILMISQALSTGGLLMMLGHLPANHSTSLWEHNARFAVIFLTFIMAGIGLPGLGNFVGEWLILWGAFSSTPLISVLAAIGIVLSAAYSLRLFHLLSCDIPVLRAPQVVLYSLMIIALLLVGLYPSFIFRSINYR